MTEQNNQNLTSKHQEQKKVWEIAKVPVISDLEKQLIMNTSSHFDALCCESFLPKLKPELMTEEDYKTTLMSLQHYLRMCQPDSYKIINEIIRYFEISKYLRVDDIAFVRLIMNKVRDKYLINIWKSEEMNLPDKEDLISIYRLRINEIEIVLLKL